MIIELKGDEKMSAEYQVNFISLQGTIIQTVITSTDNLDDLKAKINKDLESGIYEHYAIKNKVPKHIVIYGSQVASVEFIKNKNQENDNVGFISMR